MHIAILDADAPVPAVYARRGLYSSQFKKLLQEAAARVHESPSQIHTTAYDVVGGCLPSLDSLRKQPCPPTTNGASSSNNNNNNNNNNTNPLTQPIDSIIITGSSAGVYATATHPWITPLKEFIQTVFTSYPHVRLFGACFGHQLIAQALLHPTMHVEVCPAGFEIGPVDISLSEPFARAFAGPCRSLRAGPDCMRLQVVHGDWVVPSVHKNGWEGGLPSPWVNVGSSAACAVQGLYYPGRVLTFQGHFEFDGFVNRETCREFGRRLGWGEERIRRVLEEIGGSGEEAGVDDSGVAAEVVLRFFEGRD